MSRVEWTPPVCWIHEVLTEASDTACVPTREPLGIRTWAANPPRLFTEISRSRVDA
jgi:hypothetical protein